MEGSAGQALTREGAVVNTQIIGVKTYINSKGVERPLVTIEHIRVNPKPHRVMVRGREVSAWRYPGLALVAARRADAALNVEVGA